MKNRLTRLKQQAGGLGLGAVAGALMCAAAAPAAGPLYGAATTSQEIRFGGAIGSGAEWSPESPQIGSSAGFGGRAALTCSGLDYGGFLNGYNAGDFLRELRNQFVSGAQAAAMNYLLVLAYSNPTVASVLDTMNQSYSAKFGSFQLSCNSQEARRQGMSQGARRMAAAQDQCYESQVASGASPTQAYQTCANEETLGAVAAQLPAARSMLEFISQYTNLQPGSAFTALLGLLPDSRVGAAGLEISAPRVSLYQFSRNAEGRIAGALQRVLDGAAPADIPPCAAAIYMTPSAGAADSCLPADFAGVVQSPAFLGARNLSPDGKQLYRDALAAQIAVAATRGAVLELMSQVRQLDVRAGAGAAAADVIERKKELQEQIALLQTEADALQAFQQSKANTVRTQILAMDLAAESVRRSASLPPAAGSSSIGYDLLRGLVGN